MKYLDEDIEIKVSGLVVNTSRTYNYTVDIDYDIVFRGNCFLQAGQTEATIYVNDIIASYKYDFSNFARTNREFTKAVSAPLLVRVDVRIQDSTSQKAGYEDVALIHRYPHRLAELEKDIKMPYSLSTGILLRQGNLLPHIPYLRTTRYGVGFVMDSGFYRDWDVKISGQYVNTVNLPVGDEEVYARYIRGYELFKTGVDLPTSDFEIGIEGEGGQYQQIYYNDMDYDADGGEVVLTTPEQELFRVGHSAPSTVRIYGRNVILGEFPTPTTQIQHGTVRISGKEHPNLDFISFSFVGGEWSVWLLGLPELNPNDTWILDFDYQYVNEREDETEFTNIRIFAITGQNYVYYPLAMVDVCPAKYYLQWVDRYGSLQSQPFDGTETFSESIKADSLTDYKGNKRNYHYTVSPKWTINSKWIDEKDYPYYESIFVSPYLVLFDTQENKAYDVIMTKPAYTEKTFKNQGRKMLNIKLDLELDKDQNILN